MARNSFYKDASRVFKVISKDIADEKLNNDWLVIQNSLLFAIGIEKLLKSILYDINPLYILEQPDFKNSVLVEYAESVKDKSELGSKKPDGDVIAFQSSVLRCIAFSKTVLDHKNTLMGLKNFRDIIVHHNFSNLDLNAMRTMLLRDYYPLLSELSSKHDLAAQGNFFNNLHSKLASISGALQDDVEKQIKLNIESKQSKWNQMSGSHTFNRKACEQETLTLLNKDFTYPTTCPSCNNYAIVFTTPIMEYDVYRQELTQTGLETKGLECAFCKLKVHDAKELDYLNIKPEIDKRDLVIEIYSDGAEAST